MENVLATAIKKLETDVRYQQLLGKMKNQYLLKVAIELTSIFRDDRLIELFGKLKEVSEETYIHSIDVFLLTLMMKKNSTTDDLRGALFHDIGKIETPEKILKKPSRLSEEEYEEMKKHTLYGYYILKDLGYHHEAEIALYHHEAEDGSGYYSKQKNELTDVVRLIHIVDVYSALTMERSYKRPFSTKEAFDILVDNEKSYDTKILKVFKEKCLA